MRTLMKVRVPVEAGNRAVKDGTVSQIIGSAIEDLKPEAAYFLAEDGQRTVYMVFDLKQSSEIPSIAERFFLGLQARVDFYPVMNAEELRTGLEKMA